MSSIYNKFLGCDNITQTFTDPRYCYQNDINDKRNEGSVVRKLEGGEVLFCILIDNQEEDQRYLDRKGSTNISDFNSLVSRHQSFTWPDVQETILRQKHSLEKKENKLHNQGKYIKWY